VAATYNKDNTLASVTVSGKEIDPAKTYTVATIDYLAGGGDYMKSLKNGRIVAQSQKIVYYDLINYIKKNYSRKKINPSNTLRFAPAAN
jgi:2',3'-cyclic-nucleotide 2'-phosphodiesterase (5'-nucleotidase family)